MAKQKILILGEGQCRDILTKMLETCPVCHGKGEVKKWESVDPATKLSTGWFRGMKSCPYCGKARKVMG